MNDEEQLAIEREDDSLADAADADDSRAVNASIGGATERRTNALRRSIRSSVFPTTRVSSASTYDNDVGELGHAEILRRLCIRAWRKSCRLQLQEGALEGESSTSLGRV